MPDTTGYLAFCVVLCTYIGANAYCHMIGRDDENVLSSFIDQSDDTLHLLRYRQTKQQSVRLNPSRQSNHTASKKNDNKTVNVANSDIGRRIEHAIVYSKGCARLCKLINNCVIHSETICAAAK